MRFPGLLAAAAAALVPLCAQVQNYQPVTTEMLVNPNPNDWLMYSHGGPAGELLHIGL